MPRRAAVADPGPRRAAPLSVVTDGESYRMREARTRGATTTKRPCRRSAVGVHSSPLLRRKDSSGSTAVAYDWVGTDTIGVRGRTGQPAWQVGEMSYTLRSPRASALSVHLDV